MPDGAGAPEAGDGKLSAYQKRLFLFLSVATFFEGYDFLALTQILPNLREDMNLPQEASGYIVGFINAGTILAFWLVRRADTWGRRRVLTITIAGYTLCTFASGLAPDVYTFAVLQLVARIFLISEWAISMVIAAEEFPASKRGMVMGVIQGCSSLGAIFCAGVVPLLLQTEYGWRTVYLVGIVPLVILAFARRSLKETQRFTEAAKAGPPERIDLFAIWKTPYAKRLALVALVWFIAYIPAQNAVAFWKEFAMGERQFDDAAVSKAITIAALASMPMVFYSGRLLDKIGRRRGAVVIFTIGAAGVVGCYTLHGFWPLTLALVGGIFAASAFMPILTAYNTELFPTHLRGVAYAWGNNLIGRLGYVLSPVAVGFAVRHTEAFGPVVASLAVFNFVALWLVLRYLPETKGMDLDASADVEGAPASF